MAWTLMDVEKDIAQPGRLVYHYTSALAAAGNGISILIPAGAAYVTVTAQGGGGASACVYTSTDSVDIVKADAAVTWVAWNAGSVTAAVGSVFYPVSAIRVVQTSSGTSKLTVRCQS